MKIIKQYGIWILLSLAFTWLTFADRDFFWVLIFVYIVVIYLFLNTELNDRLTKFLKISIWTLFLLVTALTFYTNYYLPHGPSYPTGDIVCMNDGRGPCGESYIEDTTNLDIPEWAKFLRDSKGGLLWMGLLFAGIVVSNKKRGGIARLIL